MTRKSQPFASTSLWMRSRSFGQALVDEVACEPCEVALLAAAGALVADREHQPRQRLDVLAHELIRRHLVEAVVVMRAVLAERLGDHPDALERAVRVFQSLLEAVIAVEHGVAVIGATARRIEADAAFFGGADVALLAFFEEV